MSPPRRISRRTLRFTVRELARLTVRTRWRAPDDLGAALAAFTRAVRAHRRLARLAPRFFDSAVVGRERREREAQRLWIAECELALAKVYGTGPPPPPKPGADLPPLPSPRTQRAVEYQLTFLEFWLALGHQLLERHFRRHPHALPTHSRITRILELGFKLARLACGADLKPNDDLHLGQPVLSCRERAL